MITTLIAIAQLSMPTANARCNAIASQYGGTAIVQAHPVFKGQVQCSIKGGRPLSNAQWTKAGRFYTTGR